MLLKLIKFKLRSVKKGLILILAGMLSFAAIFALSINLLLSFSLSESSSTLKDIAIIFIIPLLTLSVFGFFFAMFAGYALSAYSAYQTYGKSSAYLYFTLPASRNKVYAASVCTVLIKMFIISVLAILLISFVFVTFSLNATLQGFIADFKEVFEEIFSTFRSIFSMADVSTADIVLRTLSYILNFAVSTVYTAIFLNFACIYGCSLAKKHKLLGCILTGIITNYSLSFAHSIVVGIPTFIIAYLSPDAVELSAMSAGTVLADTLFYAAATVIMHVLATKKLNNSFDVTA